MTQAQLFIIDAPLPGLDRVQTAKLVSWFSDQTCGEGCWKAKEDVCRCECGGKNHGIHLRTGEKGVRASKISGYRYELAGVGKYKDLLTDVENMIRDADVADGTRRVIDGALHSLGHSGNWFRTSYVHPTEYNRGGGQYVLKYASLPQCLKWDELAYFGIADDRDRYHAAPAILWKREDVPTYL
jgi:hypothetical protein